MTTDATPTAAPTYTRAHVDHCAFPAWSAALQHVCIKSVVVPLPPAFVSLLLADGVKVPAPAPRIQELHDDQENDSTKVFTPAQPQLQPQPPSQEKIEIQRVRDEVELAITQLGGRVCPKLNWSCPQDAAWMLGSLQCTSFEDVFLLLKASDFVVHDLTEPYAGCSPEPSASDEHEHHDSSTRLISPAAPALAPASVSLVLKKWCNFFDSMHFRCVVVGRRLVGISQRRCDEFFDVLLPQQDALCETIYRFFHDHLRARKVFPDPDFFFDVYVDKQSRVFLLDINVFGGVTDPLLFSWEELLAWRDADRRRRALQRGDDDSDDDDDDDEQVVDFRIVESQKGIRANPLSSYRTPTDFVDHLANDGGFDAFIQQVRRDNAAEDSSSDDDTEAEDGDDDADDDVVWGSDNDDYD